MFNVIYSFKIIKHIQYLINNIKKYYYKKGLNKPLIMKFK